MMMKKQCIYTIFALVIMAGTAKSLVMAKVYTCIEHGSVVYTSNPQGSCRVTQLPQLGSYSSYSNNSYRVASAKPRVKASIRKVSRHRASMGYAGPRSTVNVVPRGSDNTRRTILTQELANERNALAQAQRALSQSRALKGNNYAQYQSRVRQLESNVLDRQQNIQALQRELGRM